MNKKKNVAILLTSFSLYDFECNLTELIDRLTEIREKALQRDFQSVQIDHHSYHDYGCDELTHEWDFYGLREETDEEYQERVKEETERERARKAQQEREEKELLEKLKTKYES